MSWWGVNRENQVVGIEVNNNTSAIGLLHENCVGCPFASVFHNALNSCIGNPDLREIGEGCCQVTGNNFLWSSRALAFALRCTSWLGLNRSDCVVSVEVNVNMCAVCLDHVHFINSGTVAVFFNTNHGCVSNSCLGKVTECGCQITGYCLFGNLGFGFWA